MTATDFYDDDKPDNHEPKDGPLTDQQRRRKEFLEGNVEQSLDTIGQALYEINRSRLYREMSPTFDGYLADRWPGISRATAYRRIAQYKVETELAKCAPDLPRPGLVISTALADHPDLANKWRQCVAEGITTASAVREFLKGDKKEDVEAEIKPAKPNPLSLRLQLHVPEEFIEAARDMLGPHKLVVTEGRYYLRKPVLADSAAELLIEIGHFLQDNSVNPFTLSVSL